MSNVEDTLLDLLVTFSEKKILRPLRDVEFEVLIGTNTYDVSWDVRFLLYRTYISCRRLLVLLL